MKEEPQLIEFLTLKSINLMPFTTAINPQQELHLGEVSSNTCKHTHTHRQAHIHILFLSSFVISKGKGVPSYTPVGFSHPCQLFV